MTVVLRTPKDAEQGLRARGGGREGVCPLLWRRKLGEPRQAWLPRAGEGSQG